MDREMSHHQNPYAAASYSADDRRDDEVSNSNLEHSIRGGQISPNSSLRGQQQLPPAPTPLSEPPVAGGPSRHLFRHPPVAPPGLEPLVPIPPFAGEFHVYGSTAFREDVARNDFVRLFVGQLPYHLEAAHVVWILELLSARRVPLAEKMLKWTRHRQPLGCFHVYCAPEDAYAIMLLDRKVLCDELGLWHARTEEEAMLLEERCRHLEEHKEARTPFVPYQLMTVKLANSSYHVPPPHPNKIEMPPSAPSAPVTPPPELTAALELRLAGEFIPYGATAFREEVSRYGLVQLFVGQVPYHLEPAHVMWMLELLSGRSVPGAEKLWRRRREPRGCFHVYCALEDVAALLRLDKKVQCEESGLWLARTDEEAMHLAQRSKHLFEHKEDRKQNTPFQLMTVELATVHVQAPPVAPAPTL
ncbi:Hypothetical protein, putative [Bodo saltans]|uniref:RNA-binding protein n=1 Tax=Bodo saltans TaxID=75058 RepID=A0A0S4J6M7_BODSA|nr:Hypothetical protein, putative [Bodo saltans]|eukprot:CUG84809.1 Hypothetical protein, putative [Bodo saltans]